MPRTTANHHQTPAHYTRAAARGEAVGQGAAVSRGQPGAQTQPNQPKEITMSRTFATVAVLALTVTAVQAQTTDLSTRIQRAAEAACAPERASGSLPASHYGAIYQHCVWRLNSQAAAQYEAQAAAQAARKLASN